MTYPFLYDKITHILKGGIKIYVYKEWLSKAEIQYLRDSRWYECDTHFYSEQAIEDLYVDFGNLKISIETVEIKFS